MGLEDELGTCSSGRHFSELDQIRTYHSPLKHDVWPEQDEDIVNSLLLKEIDFLTLPALQQDPEPINTRMTGNHPTSNDLSLYPIISTPNTPPTDRFSLHPLSWSWCWEDSISSFPSETSFCDSLTDNFDILSYTENSVDVLLQQQPDSTNTSAQTEDLERSAEVPETEPIKSFGLPQGSERPKKLQQSRQTKEQFQESVRSEESALSVTGASEEEGHFTRIKEHDSEADCNSQSRSWDNISIEAESSAQNTQKQRRRDVNEPKRPRNGFIRYSVKHRAELSRRYPYKDNRSISKLLGVRWKKLTAEEKRPYEEEFNKDIHKIRSQNPLWRYAPAKTLAQELVDPMTSRLRPRDKIRSRSQELKNMERDWDSPSRERWEVSNHLDRQSPLQNSATTWKQCDLCSLWRPLPGHVDARDLPQTWSCFMNPDHRFSTCGTPSSLHPDIPSTQFHHSVGRAVSPVAAQVRQSGCHQSIVSNQCVSLSQSPLLLVYSTIPTLYAPTSNVTHTIIVNQFPAI